MEVEFEYVLKKLSGGDTDCTVSDIGKAVVRKYELFSRG